MRKGEQQSSLAQSHGLRVFKGGEPRQEVGPRSFGEVAVSSMATLLRVMREMEGLSSGPKGGAAA